MGRVGLYSSSATQDYFFELLNWMGTVPLDRDFMGCFLVVWHILLQRVLFKLHYIGRVQSISEIKRLYVD